MLRPLIGQLQDVFHEQRMISLHFTLFFEQYLREDSPRLIMEQLRQPVGKFIKSSHVPFPAYSSLFWDLT